MKRPSGWADLLSFTRASSCPTSISFFAAVVLAIGGFSIASAEGPDEQSGPALDAAAVEGTSPKKADESDKAESPSAEADAAGESPAPGMVTRLQQEIVKGLRRRGIYERFDRFRRYADWQLRSTAARYTGSEVKGNCRLKWYEHLFRNPLLAVGEAEQFTRLLHKAVLDDHEGLGRVLATAAEKLDLKQRKPRKFTEVDSPEQALEVIKRALTDAQLAYCKALSPLDKREIRQLTDNLYPILTGQARVGHALRSNSTGRRMCDLMEKLDRRAMHDAVEVLIPIADPRLLEQLAAMTDDETVTIAGVGGGMVGRIDTPSGAILIGGRQKNTYRLDKMPGVGVVIDLGGDDVYYEGSVALKRPVLIIIDLDGNDAYEGTKPGVQGSAILGVSMLLDCAGDDVYRARDVAQGSCIAGAGILIDYAGNDVYVGIRRVQGQAMGGTGILIDRNGNDRYHAALWAQGMGGPLGFGLLDDLDGKDHYYCGGMYLNSYLDDDNPTPGYEGWGQGMGGGLRGVANGGIGVILDGGGDDLYEYD